MDLPSAHSKVTVCSDGIHVLCSSLELLEDATGYVWCFLLIMHHHPVSHLPHLCAKVYSLSLWVVLIWHSVKAHLSLLEKAKAMTSAATQLGALLDSCGEACS